MKYLITLILVLLSLIAVAQTKLPKKHVYYDTVQVVNERVDFTPDTIPVYYLELIIPENAHQEQPYQLWHAGFVICLPYNKDSMFAVVTTSTLSRKMLVFGNHNISNKGYFVDDYEFSDIPKGKFLDIQKHPVPKGNIVVRVFKR